MICWGVVRCQQLTDLIGRGQVADIIHKELTQTLQNQSIRQRIFLYKISCHNGFIYLFDIIGSVFLRSVSIRARQTAFYRVFIKKFIFIADTIIILAILLETKRKNMNLNVASGKKGCQICTQQKSIGAGHIDVIFALRVKAVDCQLKLGTHLNLIYKKIVGFPGLIMIFYISV